MPPARGSTAPRVRAAQPPPLPGSCLARPDGAALRRYPPSPAKSSTRVMGPTVTVIRSLPKAPLR